MEQFQSPPRLKSVLSIYWSLCLGGLTLVGIAMFLPKQILVVSALIGYALFFFSSGIAAGIARFRGCHTVFLSKAMAASAVIAALAIVFAGLVTYLSSWDDAITTGGFILTIGVLTWIQIGIGIGIGSLVEWAIEQTKSLRK